MCGLTGVWEHRGDAESALLERLGRMAAAVRHRGPDDEGFWTDARVGVGFGFRRLAILDLSPTGHQPMASRDGRFTAVFNGEIYNYRDLREALSERGHAFRGTSDTEVLLAAAHEWGPETVFARLWGMFAIALWDRDTQTLYLGRDRLGKKPLYYAEFPTAFLFGSELKALRAHPAFEATVDRDALAGYFRYGYVPSSRAIYQRVHKVPPGAVLVRRADRPIRVTPYWTSADAVRQARETPLALDDREAVDALDGLLRDAVSRRMISDVPLGAFLSGGIDSSMVVALMQAQSTRPVQTFTVGYHTVGYNEAQFAKAVARHLGTDHTELYVTPDQARSVIPRLPDLYDEPFADSSQIPTFLVSELARRTVTVSLSGDGGDEVFGGYTRYLWAERLWRRMASGSPAVRQLAARTIETVPPSWWNAAYAAVEPLVPRRLRQTQPGDKLHKVAALLDVDSPDELYRRLVSYWKDPAAIVINGRETADTLDSITSRAGGLNFTERMMFLDLANYLPEDILVKVDRASMGVSLEARAPLLDHRVVEWSWRLPLTLKRRDGVGKWILRQLLYRYVPPELVERPKMGFGVPIGDWLRGPLREWADTLLDPQRLRDEGFLRPDPIVRVWRSHLRGHQNHQYRLWLVLMFQAWRERWRVTA